MYFRCTYLFSKFENAIQYNSAAPAPSLDNELFLYPLIPVISAISTLIAEMLFLIVTDLFSGSLVVTHMQLWGDYLLCPEFIVDEHSSCFVSEEGVWGIFCIVSDGCSVCT